MNIPPRAKALPADGTGEKLSSPPATPPVPPGGNQTGKAVASLVLAIVAPASLLLTVPFASLAMLLTYPYNGPSQYPWLAPMVFWSLPMIFGVISTVLGAYALRKSGRHSEGSGLAVASLCISGAVFVVGLVSTLRFVYMMQ